MGIMRAIGLYGRVEHYAVVNLGLIAYLDDDHEDAWRGFGESLAYACTEDDAGVGALALFGLALVSASADPRVAATLHGAADAAFRRRGERLESLEQRLCEDSCARLRETLGADGFHAAYKAGETLSLGEAGELAERVKTAAL